MVKVIRVTLDTNIPYRWFKDDDLCLAQDLVAGAHAECYEQQSKLLITPSPARYKCAIKCWPPRFRFHYLE